MKSEIKNLNKAAKRILKAVKSKERIIIYGDADLDGVASVIVLKEVLKNLGLEPAALYFPDREKEGYGVTETALDYLKKHVPAILITLDCGIGSFKELKKADKLGFEVLIIDHHEILDKLPKASIIVDPKQRGEKYPFKGFANVGLVFKLSETLLAEKMTPALRKSLLELTAIATIADMMPQVDENEKMIRQGLNSIETSWRPGIKSLFELKEIKGLSLMEKIYRINSLLNIKDIKDRFPAAFCLLTASSENESRKLAEELFEKGIQKRERIKEITEEVEAKISLPSHHSAESGTGSGGEKEEEPIVFEGNSKWELALLGVVASILSKKYKKPVFLYKEQEGESQGGIRAPKGFDVVSAMKTCSRDLITYGGHKQAAGFRLKNKNLDKFRKCMMGYFLKLSH